MNELPLFTSTVEGKRRSTLFGLAILTGFLCIVAGTAVFVSGRHLLLAATLLFGLGGGAFLFALFVFTGRLDGLVENDQLLWRLVE